MKSFLGVRHLARDDLEDLVDRAAWYASTRLEPPGPLDGLTVGALFFEPSTRTRLSFDVAARRLGAHTLTFFPEQSSLTKGETLQDTALTVLSLGVEILVVRHSTEGAPDSIHRWTGRPVINAGDGANEHPTQALGDLLTLQRHFGTIAGLSVAIVGDISHSRVAGSLMHALPTLGAEVTLVGPSELLPTATETALATSDDLDRVVGAVDVVYLLRVQNERGANIDSDYNARFQMGLDRAARMRASAVVMHPGPMNRGVEISDEVADGPRSLVLDQVSNGVPARMAVLAAIGEGL